jgi:hypothetical protein
MHALLDEEMKVCLAQSIEEAMRFIARDNNHFVGINELLNEGELMRFSSQR